MANEPEQTRDVYSDPVPPPPPAPAAFEPATGQPLPPEPPASQQQQLIAPVWHTIVIVAIILVNSYFGAKNLPQRIQSGRILLYCSTLIWQVALLGLVWIGLRLKKTKLSELIGGRWNSMQDFLIDVAIAAGFWVVATIIRVAVALAMGLATLDPQQSMERAKQTIGGVMPRTAPELLVFLILVVFVGIFEEILFRGYLQRQIGALARNAHVGLVISAIIFGAAHGYQGSRQMIMLAIFGATFGALALWRKSLRPGMMAHAWQDALSGVIVYVLTKIGKM